MTTDTQQNASDAAQAAHAGSTDSSAPVDESAQVLAKARFEAFGLMTEARKEAESIIDEAKGEATDIVREAEMTAESIRDAARIQADDVRAELSSHVTPGDATASEHVSDLEAEHQELTDQVGSLRELADQLEQRFAQLAASSDSQPEANEVSSATPKIDYSPSVAPPTREAEYVAPEPEEKGSFYSRRSAKLPSIGDAGGKSALDMMRSIRSTLDDDS